MLPSAGWAEILPARSSVSEVEREDGDEEPDGGGRTECVAGSMGRRGARSDIWRACDCKDDLEQKIERERQKVSID